MSDNYDQMSDKELADKFRQHLAEEGIANEHSIYPESRS